MKLYDEKGNLVDADGKILKTVEELEADKPKPKPVIKKASETIVLKDGDDIVKAVKDMADILQKTSLSAGERLEAQTKMKGVLEGHIKKFDEFQTITEASLGALTEEQEENNKSVFDIAMKEPVLQQWGYTNDIERALYMNHTKYDFNKGLWKHDGKAYDLDDRVYELNDMIFLTGMHNSLKSQKTRNPLTYTESVKELESYKLFQYELNRRGDLRKALNTSDGSDWIPTAMSSQLIDDLRLELKVAALFPSITLPARSGSFDNPFQGSRRTAYLQSESTSDSSSKIPADTFDTGKVTFTAIKHALRMIFSDEMDEDSAVAIMPLVRMELIQAIVDAAENAILNGDNSGTHMDSDVTSGTDVRKSWLGLRYHSGNSAGNAAVDISTLSIANLRSIRKKMGRFGVNPKKLAWITGISGYIQMLGIEQVETMDKFGIGFTVKAGQLGQLDGAPIIISEFMRQDLNTSGVHDGTTETDTEILLTYTPGFWSGEKPSGLVVETDRNIETGQDIAVASRRIAFERVQTPAGSGEQTVGVGYSLTA